jgi:protease I
MARLAILVGEGFEDSEFQVPYEHLKKAGHDVDVMGIEADVDVYGKRNGYAAHIDVAAHAAYPDHYDALVIPGGYGPDRLRTNPHVVDFVRAFMQSGKPVAAICHGPQLLIEADSVRGRSLTSWPSIKTDLLNAGAFWVDQEVVVEHNLITSRQPDDLDAFCKALDQALQQPPHHHRSHIEQARNNNPDNPKSDVSLDEAGFLLNPDDWDEQLARHLAQQEGLQEMTEARWQVIYALRQHYMQHHNVPNFRHLCEMAQQDDVYCMERLFQNDGSKAWRIAGLPNPGEEIKSYL